MNTNPETLTLEVQDAPKAGQQGRCAVSPGSAPLIEAPCITAWKKATRAKWKAHNRADDRFQKILGESPRRPWRKHRLARASDEWERTLDAIPMPPAEEAEKWENDSLPNTKVR